MYGVLGYETKEEVMEWMLDIQLGRRNLSPIQRIAIAEKYRSIYEKQAKENLSLGGRNGGLNNTSKPSQNSSNASSVENKIDVRAKLAETAGVSTDTYSKGKKILDSDNEEVKNAVLSGEMSINAGYEKVRDYSDEDSIIKDLLETNIRQRGDVGGSAKKVGLRIKELERLYGIKEGNNQYSLPNNSVSTQSDIASQMGMSVDTLQNYKLLAEMIPELEELIDTGIVTKTTALAIMKNLSNQ